MAEHRYITGQARGTSPSDRAEINILRSKALIEDTTGWLACCERFKLKGCFLPLFDSETRPVEVRIQENSSGDIWSASVTHERVFREVPDRQPNFIYDLRDVATGFNTALNAACVSAGVPGADIPTFELNSSGTLFLFRSNASFRGAYEIIVNEAFEYYFNTFYFTPDAESTDYYVELNADEEIQEGSTLEFLSPITRIALETNLDVENEFIPPPNSSDNEVADNVGSFLVDYTYNPQSNQGRVAIEYVASGIRRWHSMTPTGTVRDFTLRFVWYDSLNNRYPIILGAQGFAEAKMLFKGELPIVLALRNLIN